MTNLEQFLLNAGYKEIELNYVHHFDKYYVKDQKLCKTIAEFLWAEALKTCKLPSVRNYSMYGLNYDVSLVLYYNYDIFNIIASTYNQHESTIMLGCFNDISVKVSYNPKIFEWECIKTFMFFGDGVFVDKDRLDDDEYMNTVLGK